MRSSVGPAGKPPLRLVLLGDSTALGVGVDRVADTVGGQLAALLAEAPGGRRVELSSVAVAGSRSADLATQVARALVGPAAGRGGDPRRHQRRDPPRSGPARPPRSLGRRRAPAARRRHRGRRRHLPRPRARCGRSRRRCGRSSAGTAAGWPGPGRGGRGGRRASWSTWPRGPAPVFRADAGHALPRRLPPVGRRLPGVGARAAARRRGGRRGRAGLH